jgi:hypothetical protein
MVAMPVTGGNMKILLWIFVGLMVAGGSILLWLGGLTVGLRHNYTKRLQEQGLDRQTVALYSRARRILTRLQQETDLSGAMAGDVLSPETKQLVEDWLTDHRKKVR